MRRLSEMDNGYLAVRVDTATKTQAAARAAKRGVTLSEYLRQLLAAGGADTTQEGDRAQGIVPPGKMEGGAVDFPVSRATL